MKGQKAHNKGEKQGLRYIQAQGREPGGRQHMCPLFAVRHLGRAPQTPLCQVQLQQSSEQHRQEGLASQADSCTHGRLRKTGLFQLLGLPEAKSCNVESSHIKNYAILKTAL